MISSILIINILLLGLASSLQPCLFPVLPTFVAYLTNSNSSRLNGIISGILLTLGIMTIFIILGLVFNSIIGFFSINYRNFQIIQGTILILLGIFLIIGLTLSWSFLDKMNNIADSIIQRFENPWLVSYLIGFFFTLLAAPCAIIVFGTAFSLISGQTVINTILLMVLFSFSAGIPFLLVGGLLPGAKDVLIENRANIEKYISVIVGVLVIGTGGFLTLEGLRVI